MEYILKIQLRIDLENCGSLKKCKVISLNPNFPFSLHPCLPVLFPSLDAKVSLTSQDLFTFRQCGSCLVSEQHSNGVIAKSYLVELSLQTFMSGFVR